MQFFKFLLKIKFSYHIEQFYFNILSIIMNLIIKDIPDIKLNQKYKKCLKYENISFAISPGAGDKIRQWNFEIYLNIAKN